MIRVLIAEDSNTTRELLVAIFSSDPGVDVVGQAKNGLEAVALTRRLRPDVITMDVRMPEMDGYEATRQIMVEAPTPIVIVSASFEPHDVETSMNALRAGALTVLAKPPGPGAADFEEGSRHFLATVKALAGVKVVRRWQERATSAPGPVSPAAVRSRGGEILAIAASAGGPAAVSSLLSGLPGDFPAPIVMVQHMASGFLNGFAGWLNSSSTLPVRVVDGHERLEPGKVLLAPDDQHLGVTRTRTVSLSKAPPIGGFRPSATHLFHSVAEVFGPAAVAVILTGMGNDGVDGLRAVHAAGGRVVAQDEGSSVVFGMPGSAIASGCVDLVLPLTEIPRRLRELF